MSDLKIGTTLGGQTIWSGANLPLLPDGNSVYYKSFLVYSENDKPSKVDVGLGSVQNYPIASQSEAQSGTINTAYMTPLRAKQAVDVHALRTDNPHKVTKDQVQLGLVQNYGLSSTSEAQAGAVNNKYMTPLRNQEHFVSKTTTFTRDFLTKSTALAARSKLEVLRAGTAGGEVRNNTQLDARYVNQSTQVVSGDGINGGGNLSTSRTLSVDSTVVRTNVGQTITSDKEFNGSAYLQKYFHFNDYDDNTKVSGIRGYVRDGVLTLRGNSGESVAAGISIDGSIAAGGFSGNGGALNNLQASSLSGTISYTNLQFGSTDVSNWGTAYSRSLTTISGSGNGTLTLNRQDGSTYTTNLSHNHSATDITSGTLSSSRLPTITTSMVNFANQSLNTNSNVDFNQVSSARYVGNGTEIKIGAGESINSMDSFGGETVHIAGVGGVRVYASSDNLSSGLNRSTTLIDTNGNAQFGGNVSIAGTQLSSGTNNTLNITSSSGTGYIGMTNGNWFHFYCADATNGFYFDRRTEVNGNIEVYNSGHGISSSGHYGSGRNLTNLNASNINTGAIADNYISKNFDSTRLATRYGITGGYGYNSGTGGNWGANIWSIGDDWAGNAAGTGFSIDSSQYGLTWLRDSHPNCNSISGEGLHIYRAGNLVAAIGYSGHYFDNDLRADSFRVNSDITLKDNVKLYDRKTDLSKLNLKQWIWKDSENVGSSLKNKFDTGVIAQDVEEVFPTCVSTGGDGIKSVDYGKLGVHHSIKLAEKVEQLEKRLEDFENKSIWSLLIFKMKRLLWP